jgi:hypothetical protein
MIPFQMEPIGGGGVFRFTKSPTFTDHHQVFFLFFCKLFISEPVNNSTKKIVILGSDNAAAPSKETQW